MEKRNFPVQMRPSRIHGNGLYSTKDLGPGEVIAISHLQDNKGWHKTPEGNYNHSVNPNCNIHMRGAPGNYSCLLVAKNRIMNGEELTVDYARQHWLEQPGEDWV
tara:strand:- start:756 stop:1070 length:315 start_codon:yes stop_codon:yes gene_type:complete